MNILWVQDLNPRGDSGGATITDGYYLEHLEKRGHQVIWGSKDPVATINSNSFDIAIICNAKWNDKNYKIELRDKLKENNIPWIKHEHDHACKWRALFPMVDRCQRDDCPSKITYGWQYEEAVGLIYLSPWQKEAHDFWNGFALKGIKTLITPPYIDYKKFIDAKEKTVKIFDSVMILAGMHDFKGYFSNLNFAIENPHYSYNNYTRSDVFTQDQIATLDKVKLEPKEGIPTDDVPRVMAEHEIFLHLSDGFLPFERVVMEAFFAGCKVITNKNVGATSYEWWGDLEGSINAMDETRNVFSDFVEEFE